MEEIELTVEVPNVEWPFGSSWRPFNSSEGRIVEVQTVFPLALTIVTYFRFQLQTAIVNYSQNYSFLQNKILKNVNNIAQFGYQNLHIFRFYVCKLSTVSYSRYIYLVNYNFNYNFNYSCLKLKSEIGHERKKGFTLKYQPVRLVEWSP